MPEAYSPIVRGFDAETAEQDACRIEHDLSRETFEKLKAWLEAHGWHVNFSEEMAARITLMYAECGRKEDKAWT